MMKEKKELELEELKETKLDAVEGGAHFEDDDGTRLFTNISDVGVLSREKITYLTEDDNDGKQ